ncbi:MAG: hypothetical protein KDK90_18315 [Leptospiraceae bacterium]|nr:hypothetical protein [Leptospiraceae bacterium]
MSIIKVTVFQKNINSDITREQKVKLIAQKSDFLLFPEFFPNTTRISDKFIADNEKFYLDKLLEVSEYYKGVIIGGSIIRKIKDKYYESCPIIKNVSVIEWYNKRTAGSIGNVNYSSGDGELIFILSGIRFSILLGDDLKNEELIKKIKDEKISLVFNPSSLICPSESYLQKYDQGLKESMELSHKHLLNLIRTSGIGNLYGENLLALSLYASNVGINWKIATNENSTEIIKTINVSLIGGISPSN